MRGVESSCDSKATESKEDVLVKRSLIVVVALLVVSMVMVAGCGKGKDLSGIYESPSNTTLTLLTDGTATIVIPPIPELPSLAKGGGGPGTYTFDGKELTVTYSTANAKNLTMTFKVAGDNLVEMTGISEGNVWQKK